MYVRFAVILACLGLADLAYIDLELGPRVLASERAAPVIADASLSDSLPAAPTTAPPPLPTLSVATAPVGNTQPAPASTVWALKYFDSAVDALSREEVDELRQIVGRFPTHEALEIRVVGHADARGRRDENWQLARRRAQAVAAGLRQLGFTPERLVVRSEGEDAPVVPGTSAQALAENRRVEIVINAKRSE